MLEQTYTSFWQMRFFLMAQILVAFFAIKYCIPMRIESIFSHTKAMILKVCSGRLFLTFPYNLQEVY